jgi:ATP-dependent DNA helicase PIF1
LLHIGNVEYPLINPDTDEIKPSLLSSDIIKDVIGDIIFNLENISIFSQFSILSPENYYCDKINYAIVIMLSGQEKTFLSLNTVSKECYNFLFPTEFLDNLHLSDLPPHSMILKQAMVVLLKFNVDSNLMNGTRFTVRNMYDQSLDLESITGQTTDQCILLPKIDLTPSDSTLPFSFTRRQFPIRIAFAMTINKVKGQTFNKV